MYPDQGQIATKLKGFQRGVTVPAGLEIRFATPAHGTAFDIVGRGVASTNALEQAVLLCARPALTHSKSYDPMPTTPETASPSQVSSLTDYFVGFIFSTTPRRLPQ